MPVRSIGAPNGALGPNNMNLLQYNTHLFLGTLAGFGPEYEDKIRLNIIINRIFDSDADIVSLNEVWADTVKKLIITATRRAYPFAFYQPNTDELKLGSGLLLLSKHPIDEAKFTEYGQLVGWDAQSQKGFISARILVKRDGQFLPHWVVITHTQSGASKDEIRARRAGFEQLWKAVRGLPFRKDPLFVFGDLNVIGESGGRPTAEYHYLTSMLGSLGLKDLFRLVHPDSVANPGYTFDWNTNALVRKFTPGDKVQERLDYFYACNFSGEERTLTVDVIRDFQYTDPQTSHLMDLSDHYPLKVVP